MRCLLPHISCQFNNKLKSLHKSFKQLQLTNQSCNPITTNILAECLAKRSSGSSSNLLTMLLTIIKDQKAHNKPTGDNEEMTQIRFPMPLASLIGTLTVLSSWGLTLTLWVKTLPLMSCGKPFSYICIISYPLCHTH